MNFNKKYLKYKNKYIDLKNQFNMTEMVGGSIQISNIQKYFPGAITNTKLIDHIKQKNLDRDKTHFTLSICCDEINHEKGDLPDLCRELLGEVFQMGGLGGIPFAGITGLGATNIYKIAKNAINKKLRPSYLTRGNTSGVLDDTLKT
jgi:hypothetical protein